MTASEVIKHRLVNQQILGSGFTKPEEITKHPGAIQAQEFMGYKDRSFYFNLKNKIGSLASYTFDNMIIINGQIGGTRRRKMNKKFDRY
ncbi:MAG: hypothetical protein ABIO81_00895 [Ginsengibacter sp.]